MPKKKKNEDKAKSEKSKKKSSSKEKFIDPEKLLDEYLDEAIVGLNISYLGLDRDEYKELIKEPFTAAVGQVKSKPKLSTILNRLLANRDGLMEFLAIKLAKIKEISTMNDSQLEFLVYNTKKAIISLIQPLYHEVLKRNRSDLMDILRYNWDLYGIRSPIKCSKCGFNSIMPDFSCKVCGYVMSMKEVKSQIDVINILKDLSNIDPESFKEILSAGYFYYTAEGPIAPSKLKPEPGYLFFEIILNSNEKKTLSSIHSTQQT